MKKTLQDQYLLIKEGKGHKGVFLADAKRDFPHIVPNSATFEEAAASLKTKNIISENVIGLTAVAGYEPRKKESYETAFEAFLAEARKAKENEDEKVKAEEKKVSKPVEKDLEKQYDKTDDKTPDNLIFDQIMMGYYAEMKDPKNADKTMQQLKDIVLKNLAKDPIHYTKDGQFGVKDLGYVTEHPGLGTPKEPKGKYASSGYGNLNESQEERDEILNSLKNQIKEPLSKTKDKTPEEDETAEEKEKRIEAKLNQLYPRRAKRKKDTPEESKLREVIREMIDAELEEAGRGFATMGTINLSGDGDGKLFIPKYYILPPIARKKLNLLNPGENAPTYNESLMIPHIKVLPDNTILFSNYLILALDNPSDNRNPLNSILKSLDSNFHWNQFKTYVKKFIGTNTLKYPIKGKDVIYQALEFPSDFEVSKLKDWVENELSKQYAKLQKAESGVVGRGRPVNIESLKKFIANLEVLNQDPEGGMVVVLPQMFEESYDAESLREGVEKDLADINKEAEHEVLQSKLDKIDALIDHRRSKLSKLDEDEDMKALTDKKKVKELEKDIKALEKAKSKVEKMLSKTKGKKKEIIDEDEPIEEAELNEEPVSTVTDDKTVKNAKEIADLFKDIDKLQFKNLEEESEEDEEY